MRGNEKKDGCVNYMNFKLSSKVENVLSMTDEISINTALLMKFISS